MDERVPVKQTTWRVGKEQPPVPGYSTPMALAVKMDWLAERLGLEFGSSVFEDGSVILSLYETEEGDDGTA